MEMDIDLSKVIGYSRDSLQSRALMRSIMLDLYPGKTREMNVLLDVYESGVPRKIKNDGNITDAKYVQYVQKIVDDYGMQEQWAVVGLNAWIDVCLGKGTAATIRYNVSAAPTTGVNVSGGNASGGGYTNPIVHNNSGSVNNAPVFKGKKDDYELKTITATTIEISKFVGFDESKTIIPNEIDGKKVVGIGPEAFQKCVGITELIISEGIKYIEKNAFSSCSNLARVQFPTTLKKIGTWAFSSTKIETVDLPNGISKLEDGVFSCCSSLRSVVFPDNLTEIGGSVFSFCKMLRSVALPSSVRIIGYGAFSGCTSLSQVKLNEGLKEIGGNAFKNCKGLTSMVIPSSVEKFGSKIFEGAYSFQSINIVLYCYPRSRAIEYARNNNIKIENARS